MHIQAPFSDFYNLVLTVNGAANTVRFCVWFIFNNQNAYKIDSLVFLKTAQSKYFIVYSITNTSLYIKFGPCNKYDSDQNLWHTPPTIIY